MTPDDQAKAMALNVDAFYRNGYLLKRPELLATFLMICAQGDQVEILARALEKKNG